MSDPMRDLLNGLTTPQQPKVPQDKPLPMIRGKQFNGVLYVRAEDVAAALDSQAPKANRRLIDKLRSAAEAASNPQQ